MNVGRKQVQMFAEEIRHIPIQSENVMGSDMTVTRSLDDCARFLREIAAQLAEMNERRGH